MRHSLLLILFIFQSQLTFSQTLDWAGTIEGATPSTIFADKDGNVYSGGIFTRDLDFDWNAGVYNLDSGPGSSEAIYITKEDATGKLIWAKSIIGSINAGIMSVVTDEALNVYAVGYIRGSADFDPGPGTQTVTTTMPYFNALFILKLDADGNFVWVQNIPNLYDGTTLSTMAVDPSGNVYVSGFFKDVVDFDPGPNSHPLGSYGNSLAFLLKLDTDGNYQWAKTLGLFASGLSLVAENEFLYVGGSMLYDLTIDSRPSNVPSLSSFGDQDGFVLKLKTSGEYVWAKQVGGTGKDFITGISVDSDGNIFAVGSFENTADFNWGGSSMKLNSMGSWDVFVQRIDTNGNTVWVKQIGGPKQDESGDISVTETGDVYVHASFLQSAAVAIGTKSTMLTGAGFFLMQTNSAGDHVGWVYKIPANNLYTYARQDKIYASGLFFQDFDADPGPTTVTLSRGVNGNSFVLQWSEGTITEIEESKETKTSVYPNPIASTASIEYKGARDSKLKVCLRDISDNIVREYSFDSSFKNEIDLSEFSQGVYFLTLTDSNGNTSIKKIVKI